MSPSEWISVNPFQCNSVIDDARSSKLWLYYQNVRSLRSKIDDFYVAIQDCNYDVIVLTETGLNDSIQSQQLFGAQFNVYRCDRSPINSVKKRFGGVLIAVSNRFSSTVIQTTHGAHLEQICVSVALTRQKLLICGIYIPPNFNQNVNMYDTHLASVREICEYASANDSVLICGDFNQPHIPWEQQQENIILDPSLTSAASAALVDGITLLNLLQCNFVRNYRGRLLDLVFTDCDTSIEIHESLSPLVAVDLHHPPLVMSLLQSSSEFRRPVENRINTEQPLNFARINFSALNEFLNTVDWNEIFSVDVNDMAATFCRTVRDWILANTPRRKPQAHPTWSTPHLRRLRRDKNACQRKLRRHRTSETKRTFQLASYAYRRLNASLYKSHVLRIQTNLRRYPRAFWSFVKSKRKSKDIPSKMFLNDTTSSSISETCELFSKHFASVFSSQTITPVEVEAAAANVPENVIDLRTFVITHEMVISGVKKLKSSFSPGPDGLPSIIFCRCADALAHPLSRIYSTSMEQAVFPEIWKHSFIFPTFKKGDKYDVKNYRGITSLCAASKLFEIIINDVMYFKVKSYISTVQHGFMPGRSVSTNLLEFTSYCINRLEERLQVDAVYTDIKAAFDRIHHRILLCKLSRLGASEQFISWLLSYLSCRTIRVKLETHMSSPIVVTSGVPQGSNLGPLLFAIFYNDVTLTLPVDRVLIYADDLKIYNAIKCVEDCHRLQEMLNNFVSWCRLNALTVSISKCVTISFHRTKQAIAFDYAIDNIVLERVSQVSDLGVLLDQKLTFDAHRSMIVTKAIRQLGFISRISKEFTDPHCLKALYCSFVRPILETASVVWCPYQLVWCARIERVQKCFIRRALRNLAWRNPLNLPPYTERCRLLNLDSLERRRKIQQAVFASKLLYGEINAPKLLELINFRAPIRTFRSSQLLQPLAHRSLFGQYEPVTWMIRTFSLVETLFEFEESSTRFKNKITKSSLL